MNITLYRKKTGEDLFRLLNCDVEGEELLALQVCVGGKLHELLFYWDEEAGAMASSVFRSPPTSDRIVRRTGKIKPQIVDP